MQRLMGLMFHTTLRWRNYSATNAIRALCQDDMYVMLVNSLFSCCKKNIKND